MRKLLITILFTLSISLNAIEINTYEKNCNEGNSTSCIKLGVLYTDGTKVEHNYSKATDFFIKACNLGKAESCMMPGLRYVIDKKDYTKAIHYYSKACNMGHYNGCFRLGLLYGNGKHIKKDHNQSIKFYTIACDNNHSDSCNNLALEYDIIADGIEDF